MTHIQQETNFITESAKTHCSSNTFWEAKFTSIYSVGQHFNCHQITQLHALQEIKVLKHNNVSKSHMTLSLQIKHFKNVSTFKLHPLFSQQHKHTQKQSLCHTIDTRHTNSFSNVMYIYTAHNLVHSLNSKHAGRKLELRPTKLTEGEPKQLEGSIFVPLHLHSKNSHLI